MNNRLPLIARILILSVLLLNAAACSSTPSIAAGSFVPSATVQGSVIQTNATPSLAAPTETSLPPTQTPAPPSVWVAPYLPPAFLQQLNLPADLHEVSLPEETTLRIEAGPDYPISQWVYALVAPFPTLTDSVLAGSVESFWEHGSATDFPASELLVSPQTQELFTQLWGLPAKTVRSLPENQLLEAAWASQSAWALIPFEALEPKWKVIEVGGQSPIRKEFDPNRYALNVPISLDGDGAVIDAIRSQYGAGSPNALAPATNRDPNQMTTVVMTGVTALVRATAVLMELKGMTYPGEDIRGILRQADIAHISNEIPFTPKCPAPGDRVSNLVFCSKPQYIQLLEDLGTDVVELTGDHFQDWGADAMRYTLDLYKERGWSYYGGGANLEDARKPLLIENNGNKIAFMGCNAKSPGYAAASATQPGAYHCDMNYMTSEVKRLRSEGYLPIVTFQHEEVWTYEASPALQPDFRAVAEAGAVVVSGSQAHQPQAMEFDQGAFVHYGLGNLFFDQYYEGLANWQAFMDRHVFYGGRYISTELISMMFVDWAKPRLMTPEERQDLLTTMFNVSGWLKK